MSRLDKWCIMCGAAPGEPCKVIGPDAPGVHPGDVRAEPHFYRGNDEKPAVLIPDEPPYAESNAALERALRKLRDPRQWATLDNEAREALVDYIDGLEAEREYTDALELQVVTDFVKGGTALREGGEK
jgi:hypothetical protein